jgi:hypothetical protein
MLFLPKMAQGVQHVAWAPTLELFRTLARRVILYADLLTDELRLYIKRPISLLRGQGNAEITRRAPLGESLYVTAKKGFTRMYIQMSLGRSSPAAWVAKACERAL